MLISRQIAQERGLIRYFTGKPCVRGHVCERTTSNKKCVACHRERIKQRRRATPDRRRIQNKKRSTLRLRNPTIQRKLRTRLIVALRGEYKAGSAIRDLGCTIAEFREYIAAQFQPGMSWANHGEWHLDHRKPLAAFDLTDRNQFLTAVHYTNYQPLWAADNLSKGATW